MADSARDITLHGRVFLTGQVHLVTGLHIGAARATLAIGRLDNPVVRDPLTDRPYIPGSSLKGKLRSILEKRYGLSQNQSIGEGVFIHICKKPEKAGEETDEAYRGRLEVARQAYAKCQVCPVFGIPGEHAFEPTRLIVRDVPLDEASAQALQQARTELPFTEVKWGAAIDRVTAQATPRQMERVPADAVFAPMEVVYNVYEAADFERFRHLLEALALLEGDYLGGLGSRGSGKVQFKKITLTVRHREHYQQPESWDGFETIQDLLLQEEQVFSWLRKNLPMS